MKKYITKLIIILLLLLTLNANNIYAQAVNANTISNILPYSDYLPKDGSIE